MKTLKERYIEYFKDTKNAVEVPSRNKYTILKWTDALGVDKFILLGTKGAVRANKKPIVAGSFSITSNLLKGQLESWEMKVK